MFYVLLIERHLFADPDECPSSQTPALLQQDHTRFLCKGDVYQRDVIEKSHYPIFHQMEGVQVFSNKSISQDNILEDLKSTHKGLAHHLFGP
jgi:phenylalanyl-tRNA synthetase alpha chain